MQIRFSYIVLFLLVVLSLVSLDQLLANEYRNRQRRTLAQAARDRAQYEREYFAARVQAFQSLRLLLPGSSATPEAFRRAADAVLSVWPGIEGTRLLDVELEEQARWGLGESALPSAPQRQQELAARARRNDGPAVSDVVRGDSENAAMAILVPLTGPDGKAWGYAAGSIRPAAASNGFPAFLCVLEDPAGALLNGRPFRADTLTQAEPVPIGDRTWRVRVGVGSGAGMGLLFQRLAVLTLGLLMALAFVGIYMLQSHQNEALLESHLKMQEQARLTGKFNGRLLSLNKELDDFAHVVSHDLKEPLRGIEGVSRLLIEEHGHRLDAAGLEYVRSIRESGARMRRLVDDLLRLSRITRRRYPHEDVNFNELVREVLDGLQYRMAEKKAEVKIQPDLPTLRCDRVRMAELFQNVFSNALKFTNGHAPLIRVEHRHGPEGHTFCVADNGIGIPANLSERVFEIFQRVERPGTEEGSGVGLTICKRIVDCHGGRMWIEQAPGGGARVCFVLPEGGHLEEAKEPGNHERSYSLAG